MANTNTFSGFYNLPAITLTGTSATLYTVPATGNYSTLPAPAQVAGNALVLPALAGDVSSGGILDGRPFTLSVCGKVNNAQSETITVTFYQVTAAGFSAGPTATNSTGVTTLATSTALTSGAFTGKNNFTAELRLIWDSASKTLNGASANALLANTLVAGSHVSTPITALAENDLNFMFAFTAGTTGTGDVIGPLDIYISRA